MEKAEGGARRRRVGPVDPGPRVPEHLHLALEALRVVLGADHGGHDRKSRRVGGRYRGGDLTCRLDGEQAWLGGQCVTVVEGTFYVSG